MAIFHSLPKCSLCLDFALQTWPLHATHLQSSFDEEFNSPDQQRTVFPRVAPLLIHIHESSTNHLMICILYMYHYDSHIYICFIIYKSICIIWWIRPWSCLLFVFIPMSAANGTPLLMDDRNLLIYGSKLIHWPTKLRLKCPNLQRAAQTC